MTMLDDAAPRNDHEVQEAVRHLLLGVAPERSTELQSFMETYPLRFNFLPDDGRDGKFVMEAGNYREVHFNHRVLRAFWVATFAAWEGYRVCAEADEDLTSFRALLTCVRSVLEAADPEQVPLPDGVPEPGQLADQTNHPQARAAGELAMFASGWALLHEVRHCQHQIDGTSTTWEKDAAKKHEEELSCDAFATEFILSQTGNYAQAHAVDRQKVEQKRQIGVNFALFAMAVISRDKWAATDTHPSMQQRIDATWGHLRGNSPNLTALVISMMAFETLHAEWPEVPRPGAVVEVVDRGSYTTR